MICPNEMSAPARGVKIAHDRTDLLFVLKRPSLPEKRAVHVSKFPTEVDVADASDGDRRIIAGCAGESCDCCTNRDGEIAVPPIP
jgi:hypothetical protein